MFSRKSIKNYLYNFYFLTFCLRIMHDAFYKPLLKEGHLPIIQRIYDTV